MFKKNNLDLKKSMIAHRGICRDGLHENTLSAFAIALEHTDGIECDVRLSSDREPVIIHDHTLKRTHKIDRRVQDCSLLAIYRCANREGHRPVGTSRAIPEEVYRV